MDFGFATHPEQWGTGAEGRERLGPFTGGAWHPDIMLSSTSWRRAWYPLGKGSEKRAAWNPVAPRRSAGTETETETGTGRPCTLHSMAEGSVMEGHALTLGAHLLLWVFPLVLAVLVIVENLLDKHTREPGR